MAVGDDAVAAGMSILNGSEQSDDIDLEINRTRDFIAQRTSAVVPVAKGGTGATDAPGARANLDAVSSAELATKAAASHTHSSLIYAAGKTWAFRPAPYNEWGTTQNVYIGGYLNVIGTIFNPSSRRFKDGIRTAPVLADIFPRLVEYERNGDTELGYIAEELIGTDAERFVKIDAEGKPEAIAYLSLLVAQVYQLQARVIELEARE